MRADSSSRPKAPLILAALGVVMGDIGTSPLYAFREALHHLQHGAGAGALTAGDIVGLVSCIIWSLLLVVTVKYVMFVLRADNDGEGGLLALLALLTPRDTPMRRRPTGVPLIPLGLWGGLIGTALLYGDGAITPAISVLSAVEGLRELDPRMGAWVVPSTVGILLALFAVQSRGTHTMGRWFGPIMAGWFGLLALLGAHSLAATPTILAAFDPRHAVHFLWHHGALSLTILGSVVLVVTGGEALYADLGHFGRPAIRWAWTAVALPALLLNYLGQGALALRAVDAGGPLPHLFFDLAPRWALLPLTLAATAATIIASQALISACFSVTRQAVYLGLLPRLRIVHTAAQERGQVYVPTMNWLLCAATIGLVLGFRQSTALAGAYGVAVVGTMLITTGLFSAVSRAAFGWAWWQTAAFALLAGGLDLAFGAGVVLKIGDGGWVSLAMAGLIALLMVTWYQGVGVVAHIVRELSPDHGHTDPSAAAGGSVQRIPGTVVCLTRSPEGLPLALRYHLHHFPMLHDRVVLLTLETTDRPYERNLARVTTTWLGHGVVRVVARFGFMEAPRVDLALTLAEAQGLDCPPGPRLYLVSREAVLSTNRPGMARWRERLFAIMARHAQGSSAFFGLPASSVLEIGVPVHV